MRTATLYADTHSRNPRRFIDHIAIGSVTACGIRLGMTIKDPPALIAARAASTVHKCQHPGCRIRHEQG